MENPSERRMESEMDAMVIWWSCRDLNFPKFGVFKGLFGLLFFGSRVAQGMGIGV